MPHRPHNARGSFVTVAEVSESHSFRRRREHQGPAHVS